MTDPSKDCSSWDHAIDDWLDGQLDDDAEAALRAHLASCEDCRALATDLRALRQETHALADALPPDRDLWPEIARRIAHPPAAAHDPRLPWGRGLAAVAAVVVVVLGVGYLARLGEARSGQAPGLGSSAASQPQAAMTRPASTTEPMLTDPALAATREAARALRADVETRWAGLRPATRDVLERNLDVIDRAIGEIEMALADEPGNATLETLLLANYRQKISLLERLAELG